MWLHKSYEARPTPPLGETSGSLKNTLFWPSLYLNKETLCDSEPALQIKGNLAAIFYGFMGSWTTRRLIPFWWLWNEPIRLKFCSHTCPEDWPSSEGHDVVLEWARSWTGELDHQGSNPGPCVTLSILNPVRLCVLIGWVGVVTVSISSAARWIQQVNICKHNKPGP